MEVSASDEGIAPQSETLTFDVAYACVLGMDQ